jgi:hypothetical protein
MIARQTEQAISITDHDYLLASIILNQEELMKKGEKLGTASDFDRLSLNMPPEIARYLSFEGVKSHRIPELCITLSSTVQYLEKAQKHCAFPCPV